MAGLRGAEDGGVAALGKALADGRGKVAAELEGDRPGRRSARVDADP